MNPNESVKIIEKNLEQFGTTRANYEHISNEDQHRVAQRLAIHFNRQRVGVEIREKEQQIFFHVCGDAGIEWDEARALWKNCTQQMSWNDVYDIDRND